MGLSQVQDEPFPSTYHIMRKLLHMEEKKSVDEAAKHLMNLIKKGYLKNLLKKNLVKNLL
jgi:hypothetical protein